MSASIEIAVEDLNGALIAAQSGADSIELCIDLDHGGLTPPMDLVAVACAETKKVKRDLKIHVLILNKPSNFTPNQTDIAVMQNSIKAAKAAGANGVVFGALGEGERLNTEAMRILKDSASDLITTCHRAFDRIADRKLGLRQLVDMRIDRLLTSGGNGNVPENLKGLCQTINDAHKRMIVVAGGGIRASHITAVLETKAPVLHMSCRADLIDTRGLKPTDSEKLAEVMRLIHGA